MKLYKSPLAAIALVAGAFALTGCDDNFETPPVVIPEATYEVNTAIKDFKTDFWQYASGDAFDMIPVNASGDSIIIGGRIVTSDECGNIYKQIVVEDESGAILIGINASGLNEGRYKLGEEVRVNLTGLYVGNYNGLLQIGMPYNGSIGRMDEAIADLHIQPNGLPSAEAVETLVKTLSIADVAPMKSDKDYLIENQSALVRFENVEFVGGGELAWSDEPGGKYYTTRQIVDEKGNKLTVNTSNQATFAADILPKGKGTITAILSYFKGDWQLVVSNPVNDCTGGFEFVEAVEPVFKATFTGGLDEFTVDNNLADAPNPWLFDSQYSCLVAKGYIDSKNVATDAYLVSPVISLEGLTEASFNFSHAIRYFTSVEVARTQATVAVREEGATAWTALAIPVYGTNDNFTFVNSGDIDLTAYAGKKIQLAFHYISTTAKAGTWEIKNLVVKPVKAEVVDTPDTPDVPDTPVAGDELLNETFATSMGAFTIQDVTLPAELTAIWKQNAQYACMLASAFANNTNYAADSYLVSPVVDFTGVAKPVLTFDHAMKYFADDAAAKTEATLAVKAEGDAAWTTVAIPAYPAQDFKFVSSGEIDLSAFTGKKVQVAFHYTSTAAKAGNWEIKNVLIKK